MDQVYKPISVARIEFIDSLTEMINNCGLPAYVIEPIIRDIHKEVEVAVIKQYKNDLAEYQKRLDEQQNQ